MISTRECAAAQYALNRGFDFVRTCQHDGAEKEVATGRRNADFTPCRAGLPQGVQTIDAGLAPQLRTIRG